jgi:hypothetical protein
MKMDCSTLGKLLLLLRLVGTMLHQVAQQKTLVGE